MFYVQWENFSFYVFILSDVVTSTVPKILTWEQRAQQNVDGDTTFFHVPPYHSLNDVDVKCMCFCYCEVLCNANDRDANIHCWSWIILGLESYSQMVSMTCSLLCLPACLLVYLGLSAHLYWSTVWNTLKSISTSQVSSYYLSSFLILNIIKQQTL